MRRTAVAAGMIAVLGTGVAQAHWASGGGGVGEGVTAETAPVVLEPGTPVAALHPGGSADVVVRVRNPNTAAVRLPSLRLSTGEGAGGFAVDEAHLGCGTAALAFDPARATVGWDVPARSDGVDGAVDITLTRALSLGLDAAAACQGATFTVYLEAGP